MNLSELIHSVWKDERIRERKIRKDEVKIVIEVMIDHMVSGLLNFGKIKMKGLFTLDVRKSKGRRIANPQTKEIMYSQDYYKVGLKPSKKLEKGLKELQ